MYVHANEDATLPGLAVGMNVYAVGPDEFRGTNRRKIGAPGESLYNVGLYAGLEPDPEGSAQGQTISVGGLSEEGKAARRASLKDYISRELGNPPARLSLDDLFQPEKRAAFESLRGTEADTFGLYKFVITDVQIGGKPVPAITVATNDESVFSAIGLHPREAAARILDGQGMPRRTETETVLGGSALDYFTNTMQQAEKLGLKHPKLEAIQDEPRLWHAMSPADAQ